MKSKLNVISLLLEDIISRRTNEIENYNYDTMKEDISEALDWLFIREKNDKIKVMEIAFDAFNSYEGNRFLNNDAIRCIKHLYAYTKKSISRHNSFNSLDEDVKESIFEPTSDYLIIKKKKDKIIPNEDKSRIKGKVTQICEPIYSYRRIKELRQNKYIKIIKFLPEVRTQSLGYMGKIIYKKFTPKS